MKLRFSSFLPPAIGNVERSWIYEKTGPDFSTNNSCFPEASDSPILPKEGFTDLPVVVGQHIVSVQHDTSPVIDQAIRKAITSWWMLSNAIQEFM